MPEYVAMAAASKELGLRPKEFELAVQQGEVHTVPGRTGEPRRVPRAEVDRLRQTPGWTEGLRERMRVVTTVRGAELLGITPTRFTRLARGGCLSPVKFYVNRYRTVVWLYLASELREFAARRPELLTGRAPAGLRVLLDEGADYRARHWRSRRVRQLTREAAGPWERAAGRAAVLDEAALNLSVPDAEERARLLRLRPDLVTVPHEAVATREAAGSLCRADEDDEVLWHRLMLTADLEEARAADLSGCALARLDEDAALRLADGGPVSARKDCVDTAVRHVPGLNGPPGQGRSGPAIRSGAVGSAAAVGSPGPAGARQATLPAPATVPDPVRVVRGAADEGIASSGHRPPRRARRWYDRLRGSRRAPLAGNGPAARLARVSRSAW